MQLSLNSLFFLASSLENDSSAKVRDYIEWKIQYTKDNFHLPPQAVSKLNALLEDDTISLSDFSRQIEVIFKDYNGLWWQSWLGFLGFIEKIMQGPVLLGIALFLALFFAIILTDLRYIVAKPFQKIISVFNIISERLFAAIWYWFPFMEMFVLYAPILLRSSAIARQYCPDFLRELAQLYNVVPPSFSNIYFFFLLWLGSKSLVIKSRYIRFHMMRSLMINTFSNLLANFYFAVQRAADRGQCSQEQLAMTGFYCAALVLSWIIPAIIQALTKTYPGWLVRDAVEIMLGRDSDDPDFEWWDKKKDND